MGQDDPTRQREMDGWMSRAVPGHTRASQPVHHHPCVRRLSLAPRRGRMVGRLEHRSERSPSPVEFVFWAGVSPGQLVVNRVNLPSQITVSCRRGGIWWGGVVEKQKHAPYLASRAKLMFFFPPVLLLARAFRLTLGETPVRLPCRIVLPRWSGGLR